MKYRAPNPTRPNAERGNNVTGAHIDRSMYGGKSIRKLVPSIVAEPVLLGKKADRRRANCVHEGCNTPHLKGSDYCAKHDTGEPPRRFS